MPEPVNDLDPDPVASAAPAASTSAPATTAASSSGHDEPDDDAAAVDVHGGKYVPLDVLKSVRQEMKALKQRVQTTDQLQAVLSEYEPYMQFLREHPQVLEQRATASVATADKPSPTADPELVELARSLDYFTAKGEPDIERAAKHAEIIERRARQVAEKMMAPLAQTSAQERSAANYTRALTTRAPDGRSPRPETLTWMWRNLPAAYTADPAVSQILPALALGLDLLGGQQSLPPAPAPPGSPPLVTEPSRGVPRATSGSPLSEIEQRVIGRGTINEQRYRELTANYKQGRPTILEE